MVELYFFMLNAYCMTRYKYLDIYSTLMQTKNVGKYVCMRSVMRWNSKVIVDDDDVGILLHLLFCVYDRVRVCM